jgi:hypothetical protein
MGLPLLGSPLVISGPSATTYDLLTLAHIAGSRVEPCVMWRSSDEPKQN